MSPLKFRSFVALLCLAGMIWAIPYFSNTPKPTAGAVVGWTTDARGRPVPDARVVLHDPGGRAAARGASLVDGAFAFNEVKPGAWRVAAARQGVGVGAASVTLRPGEVASATVQLKPINPTR